MNRRLALRDGKRFAAKLDKLGLNQREVGLLLERSPRCVHYYIHGERRIQPEIWRMLAHITGMKRDELMNILAKRKRK